MFGDIGWTELLVIGVVALIVIGPEDLPEMFRQLGRFTAKIRSMAREFQRAMDQAARESGVNDVAKDLKTATSAKSLGLTAVKDAADKFEKWDPLKSTKAAAKTAPAETDAKAVDTAPAAKPGPEGPATQALREKQAARKAVIEEMGAKLKAVDAGDLTVVKPAAKKPGRTRSASAAGVKTVPASKPAVKPAAKPAAKPRAKKATDA